MGAVVCMDIRIDVRTGMHVDRTGQTCRHACGHVCGRVCGYVCRHVSSHVFEMYLILPLALTVDREPVRAIPTRKMLPPALVPAHRHVHTCACMCMHVHRRACMHACMCVRACVQLRLVAQYAGHSATQRALAILDTPHRHRRGVEEAVAVAHHCKRQKPRGLLQSLYVCTHVPTFEVLPRSIGTLEAWAYQ